jgi:peptide/nickel transport system permease protein
MGAYIVRRLLQAFATLFILSIVFFFLARLQPGGPCATASGLGCAEMLHTDQPVANQYLSFLGDLAHGNLGLSSVGIPIGTLIAQKFPPTLLLIGVSLVFQQLIALPLGVLAALRPYSLPEQVLTFLSYVALSLPSFLVAIFLLYVFVVHWNLLPLTRYEDPSLPLMATPAWYALLFHDPPLILGDLVRHLLLPVIALTASGIAVDSRYMRAAMLQVMHQEYIRTAKAKGLQRRRVIFKHAFRNALLPILTNIGLYLAALLGGAVAIEVVFTWGGLGSIFAAAITGESVQGVAPDFATARALAMFSALIVIVINLVVDLAYVWLDPRIRFTGGVE